MFSKSPSYRNRLPRVNLGTRRISLSDPAATSSDLSRKKRQRSTSNAQPPTRSLNSALSVRPRALDIFHSSISRRARFVTAAQDCIVKIGWMRFPRVKGDDNALVLEIGLYVFHSSNFLQYRSEFAHTFIAVFACGRDLDGFQDGVIGAFREKRICRVGIVWSCRVHVF